ncbi:MAG: integrin alpha, partial [Actinomycetota bacterium]
MSEQKISDSLGGLTATLDNLDYFGIDVAAIGDLDGDGITDVMVSAFADDDGAIASGAVHVLFLNADGTVKAEQKISATEGGFGGTLIGGDQWGYAVAPIGDLDGDGRSEVAVSSAGFDDGGAGRGGLYVLFLNADGTVRTEQRISDTDGGFAAALEDSDGFGYSLGEIGDLDGDGIKDLAVGATGDDDGGSNRGAVYVLFMNADGTVRAEQKISDTIGGLTATLDDDDRFGRSIAGLGDLDGDGIEDLAVSADGDDDGGSNRGAVYVLFMNANGTVKAEQKISDLNGGFATTLNDSDYFGDSIAALGDLDGDGAEDLAVGAQNADDGGNSRGEFYILNLNTDGTVKTEGKVSDTDG